jgi:hypothetical protein
VDWSRCTLQVEEVLSKRITNGGVVACLTQQQSIEWLVDLLASFHICNNKKLFSMMETLAMPKEAKTASGNVGLAAVNDKVTMSVPRSQDPLTLYDVMLMESSPCNLLSQGY